MAPLPPDAVHRLIETCDRLLAERVRIERILRELGPSWGGARRALNELHRVLTARPERAASGGPPASAP
jgi:hypothetical protein